MSTVWPTDTATALAVQRQVALQVERQLRMAWPVALIAGADVSVDHRRGRAQAAIVVMRYPDLTVIEIQRHTEALRFPYVPGLLSFREGPCLEAAYSKLTYRPDLLMVDGHGLAHPRRCGLACHVGVALDCPSLGCAKSLLYGQCAAIGEEVGAQVAITDNDEVLGQAVRLRRRATPIYVSIGHRIDLSTAVSIVCGCARGYRLPEPTRLAHRAASLTATDNFE